ncbi:MAG: hypothetical protein K9G60_06665 [Pseudolabrys sp.]|nr:hypothetical protein [Pseudolabrys sp.]
MISDLERYQGVALRQIIISAGRAANIGIANETGRIDCFSIERTAFQIKYSTKRLSPWQFSFTADQMFEIATLLKKFNSAWMLLVCGVDGVVSLSAREFLSITESRPGGVCSIRVSRSKNSMYRISGNAKELPFAKPRGVDDLVNEAIGRQATGASAP